jgi:hypothetical protein
MKFNKTQYKRNCPKCNKILYYIREKSKIIAEKINKMCRSCSQIGHKATDESRLKMSLKRKGCLHHFYGKHHSEETKKKLSIAHIGKNYNSPEYIKKLKEQFSGKNNPMYGKGYLITGKNNPFYGKHHSKKTLEKISKTNTGKFWSEERKQKQRERIIKKLEERNIVSFNPKACHFIDEYGKKYGYNFQHALNKGEKIICGYRVDGYDEEKNIIFEYDEPYHEIKRNKIKDVKRQNRLLLYTNGKIIRYSEKYNIIYEVGIDMSLIPSLEL